MQACPAELNYARYLTELNQTRADKTAYIDDNRRMTYGELATRVSTFAGLLKNLGIRREERILLVMHDTIDWPVVFLGAMHGGVVPVAVNTLLTAEDYAYMLEHSRAQAIFTSPALLDTVQKAVSQSNNEVRHIVVAEGGNTLPAGIDSFESLMDRAPQAPAVNTKADEIAFWLYSSGSTGQPKGVVHCHANLWHTAELYGKPVLGLKEDDIVFSAAKLFFAYGLGNGLTFPLSVGATVVLMGERPTPDAVFKRLTQHKPTVFYGVPTLYASMLASPNLPARADVNLRVCASAGEALPKDLGDRFTRHFGCHILDGIGSTEMLHIFISNQTGDVRYGTTGKPVPGYEIELRDDHGKAVPAGTIGDLYIKGPSAAIMYWNNRAKTRETMLGDWLKSGDKYICDAEGYYTYAGRSDDMIKVSGQYVSPVEVENVLIEHESVLEAAVIGVTDDQGLVKTTAYVVLREGKTADGGIETELQAYVKSQLAPFKYPRTIHFVNELPKTATGKIQRFRLRQRQEQ
ncbi:MULTISPECIES: benzoate-CoA ligase family protein [unclassified Pusillimonas]|uniref:benzoate-CoA ligase family protein n=1 Tax=unclassified Pusillimonas TaxID=2640016 RepID=UPI000B8ECBC0|nr:MULTISPECIES: benzoate-CoA ligase family protein [unclassified Pusillimonas]OXR50597.1 4-hydroxybenzoate--CoA ligase [Pusillimonas sp. T2]ROT45481.1 benzoate-CoA ligase family protein [Pusillimonas sp. NJUB218]